MVKKAIVGVILLLAALVLPGLLAAVVGGNWWLTLVYLWAFLVLVSSAFVYAALVVGAEADEHFEQSHRERFLYRDRVRGDDDA